MACEVKTYAEIRDFKKVQEFFGLGHDDSWLNAINSAISPTGELIALGCGEKLAFLSTCWDSCGHGNTNVLSLSWCGELEDHNQIVTQLTCLPMAHSRTSGTAVEWTCVAVGLASGMVVFYSDTGIKLFSQCCQEDPVLGIKLQSPQHSEAEALLYIVYSNCVCFIKGHDIFPTLAHWRVQLQRDVMKHSSGQTSFSAVDVIPFQKFKFKREKQTILNDAAVTSTQRPQTFDHIVDQSIGYGYFNKVNPTPAQRAQIMAAGAEPYLGFFNAEEGYKTVRLSEVAKDVIGIAYKNILGGLFRRAPEPPPPTALDAPSMPTKEAQMRTRCRLYDGKRDGLTLAVSPGGHLAAVTDNLDRVMLVDTQQAIILRVWKGYRDAQCAFVPVREKSVRGIQTHKRKAFFLIIYAPRLGYLDIWALQNGPKVAAFTVCKNGQLSYSTHRPLSSGKSQSLKPMHINYCLFLDPSDATLKEVQIPFHYALSETNSKTSRDIHMLRRLRNQLRALAYSDGKEDMTAIGELAAELQTLEVQQQCLEMLLKSKKLQPPVFQCIITAFTLADQTVEGKPSHEEWKEFLEQIENYKRLANFYISLKNAKQQASDFVEHLELADADLVTINQLVLLLHEDDAAHKVATREVKFQLHTALDGENFVEYLSVFDIHKANQITLDKEKAEKYSSVSTDLFDGFFTHGLCFEEFKNWVQQLSIPSKDILTLVIHFWLNKPFKYQNCDEVVADMSRIGAMVRTICELTGDYVNDYAYNAISPWWQEVREVLLESKQFSGLLVAIACKTIATQLWRNQREGSCDESSQNENEERWESISHDEAQWGLLTGKLEDVAVLGAILGKATSCQEPVGPEMPYEPPDCSLKSIVSGGRGIVTDFAAKWLISTRLQPAKIVEALPPQIEAGEEQNKIEKAEKEESNESEDDQNKDPVEPVLEKLLLMRAHFPFSLESGVLLSLMSWHYMVHWSKHLSSLEHLRAGIVCLAQFKETDWALKHGICCMLWNAVLKFPLQSTTKLMQKVGRLPVDKMCQQDIEMSSSLVPDFLEVCLEFLQHFTSSLEHEKRELRFEDTLNEGPLPLQYIALQQHHAMPQLLKLQYELCSVLHFIAYFQLRLPRPVTTLFDSMANKALTADINKELPYSLTSPDLVLQQQRTEFLCKVVAATMDLIREDLQQLYILDHVYFMSKICALADSWQVDKVPILRKQVVELYAFGYDTEAQVLLRDLSEDEELGKQLLEIAGRRLSLYAESSQATFLKIASIGHQLLQYLDNLKKPLTEQSLPIAQTKPDEIQLAALAKLLTHVYKCFSRRDAKKLSVLGQMYDACCLLQD